MTASLENSKYDACHSIALGEFLPAELFTPHKPRRYGGVLCYTDATLMALTRFSSSQSARVSSFVSSRSVNGQKRSFWRHIPKGWFYAGVVLAIALLGGGGCAGYRFFAKNEDTSLNTADLVTRIGAHYILPDNEEPAHILVQNPDELQGDKFFVGALAGDTGLVYPKNDLIVLYRPGIDRIVRAGTINNSNVQEESPQESVAPMAAPNVFFYNGSSVAGITIGAEEKLREAGLSFFTLGRDSAALHSYTKALVVDASGTRTDFAQQVATMLGGVVGELPSGETVPSGVDVLIIVTP